MKKLKTVLKIVLLGIALLMIGLACSVNGDHDSDVHDAENLLQESVTPIAQEINPTITPQTEIALDKFSLWISGTQLRGSNTWQRIVVPKYDGTDFLGDGYIGPPYTQDDFDRLSASGANYVNLSHPGLYTERPPYVLDEKVQANLDRMIAMAAEADMFVVITFRTGPGRNDFTFYRDDDWFDEDDLIENVWHDEEAQQAWVEMWRYTADRYKNNAVVVGYDLMCEPNAVEIVDEWDQEQFYADYGGSVYDWNRWYPEIVHAIREVDDTTPILVAGEGYSALDWLPYLAVIDEKRLVYMFHQYAPHQYTHQTPPLLLLHYPGRYDTDNDLEKELIDKTWLEDYLQTAVDFTTRHNVPVAVNEYGLRRWVPDGAQFMQDEMTLFEESGVNYALWVWDPQWQPWNEGVNGFNFRYNENPTSTEETPNELQDTILKFWTRNEIRPSRFE